MLPSEIWRKKLFAIVGEARLEEVGMTETQVRRVKMYLNGKTIVEIAKLDGVSGGAVSSGFLGATIYALKDLKARGIEIPERTRHERRDMFVRQAKNDGEFTRGSRTNKMNLG